MAVVRLCDDHNMLETRKMLLRRQNATVLNWCRLVLIVDAETCLDVKISIFENSRPARAGISKFYEQSNKHRKHKRFNKYIRQYFNQETGALFGLMRRDSPIPQEEEEEEEENPQKIKYRGSQNTS